MISSARRPLIVGTIVALASLPTGTNAGGVPDELVPPVDLEVPGTTEDQGAEEEFTGGGDVEVQDNAYAPPAIKVEPGTTVTWTHTGQNSHSVTADDGSFDSHPNCSDAAPAACMQNGETFSETFDEEGEFPYYCRIHGAPGGSGMAGVVEVGATEEEPGAEPGQDSGTEGGTGDELPATGTAPLVPLVTGLGLVGLGLATLRFARRFP